MAIPSDYNIQKKTTKEVNKYVDLQIECQRTWNKKVEVIPVIIGATGIEDMNTKKYVSWIFFSETEHLICNKTSFCQISVMALSSLRKMFIQINFQHIMVSQCWFALQY